MMVKALYITAFVGRHICCIFLPLAPQDTAHYAPDNPHVATHVRYLTCTRQTAEGFQKQQHSPQRSVGGVIISHENAYEVCSTTQQVARNYWVQRYVIRTADCGLRVTQAASERENADRRETVLNIDFSVRWMPRVSLCPGTFHDDEFEKFVRKKRPETLAYRQMTAIVRRVCRCEVLSPFLFLLFASLLLYLHVSNKQQPA